MQIRWPYIGDWIPPALTTTNAPLNRAQTYTPVHVFMTVLCILGILVVLVSWLFLMMAMPETQLESAIFLDR